MALLARKKILLAKLETTYGTDPTPTGAANTIQTSDLVITPLDGPTVSRNLDRATLGGDLQIQVGTFVTLTFAVEMAGSGVVGTAPAYAPLLLACGCDETTVAATSVTYNPNGTGDDSVTMYFAHDGQLHKLVGARGSFVVSADAGTIPRFLFTFTGLFVAPGSVGDPTPDFSAFVVPLPVNNANTTGFSLHSTAVTMTAFQLDAGNQVVYRNVVGNESVEIVDREVTGSVSFEAPTLATKNWFTIANASTLGGMLMGHGTVAGNIVSVGGTAVQLVSPTYGESDGITTIQAGLSLLPSGSGNNDYTIGFT